MRFMLIFHMPEGSWVSKQSIRRIVDWKRRLVREGHHVTGSPLKPVGMTHTLTRNPDGSINVADEPMHDGSVNFYAFEIIVCESLEQAIEISSTHPALEFEGTTMELREIWDSLDGDVLGDDYPADMRSSED